MASTISFSGLSASGLDTSSWVDALVSVKQQTVTSLESQKAEKENLLSIVNNIKSYFSSFQTCLQKLTDSQYGIASMDLFMQNLALSSNANIATATATTEAARQSYDVAVDSLATATKATSGYSQFEVKTADLNTTFGTLGGKNGTITVNSQSFNVTTDDTLGSLVDKFKNVGVDASFDEKKGTFTVGIDLDKIDEGATNLKNALKLKNNNVSGAVSGSIVYANRSTEFSKLGLTAGKITIEGVEHTIAKNGDNYTIQKTGGSAVSMNTLGEFFDYLKSSAVGAEDASVDGKGNITIKGATLDKVEGGSNLMEVLNLIESQKRTVSESGALSYVEVRNADLNTKLSALGVTGDTTLVAGGTNNTISNDKTLGDIQKILKNAGVEMNVDNRGVITIDTKGNEISGTLLDVLNLDPTKGGTTISSSAHQANLKADLNTKLSELGVKDSDKYIAYKSDGTAVTVEMTNLAGKSINTLITDLKNVGLDTTFDEKTHQIVIKDGYITGTLADVLGMTQSTTSYTENATLNTTLSALGATGDSTLTIDGGTSKTYGKDTTLQTVFDDIKDAGGKVTFKDGNVTIEGVTLGGSIPALLGLDATTQGTSVTSGKLTAVTGSSSTGGGNNATVEHDIDLNTKIGDITGTTSSYTLKVDDGTSKTYTKDTTLQELKNQIESAGGKFTINDDNTISIDGVTMSGTLVGVLGFDELETGTRFTTVDAVMISGTSNVATGGTTLGNLGLISGSTSGSTSGARAVRRAPANPNKTLSINGGTAKSYGANSSLDDIFADIVAAGGTASIDDEGYINIKGVHLEGTLVDALGLVETDYKTTITSGNLKVTTSTSSTSSSVLYSEQKGDISLNSTVGSIVGDSESYNLVVNGTNNTIGTNTKLSDIRTIIQNAGGTMTVNADNTISVNGVELSGNLVDKLGFMSNGVHTVVSSNNPIYYTDGKKSADSGSTFEQLGISADKRDFAIYKNDGTLVKASSTTGSASGKTIGDWLKTINDALNSANGTSGSVYATINNGVISISGGYVTGSLPTELGIGTTQTLTGITMEGNSVTYTEYDPLKYIGNIQTGSGTAAGNVTSTGMIGAVVEYTDELGNVLQANENTKLADILDTSGNKLGSGSFTFNVGSYTKTFDADSTTLGDVRDYVNNLNTDTTYDTNTSASIADGKIAIESNVDITGTLMSALGFAKSDVSSIAYEIKGTGKAHYSSVDSTTYTASGFSKSVTEYDSSTAVADRVYASSVSSFEAGKTYHISTIADLQKLASLSSQASKTKNVNFVLDNDIDMSSVSNFTGIDQFYGIFYGNGHVIKNITINKSGSGGSVGLFGEIDGKIQDLGLENVNITANNSYGHTPKRMNVGALVGRLFSGEVKNCYVSGGTVSGNATYIGGLIGKISENTEYFTQLVSDCWANVTVNKTSYSKDSSGAAGGLVALSGGSISNSYSLGDVNSAYGYVGGFIGIATGTISNSFSTGNVKVNNSSSSNTTYIGGFAGALGQTGTMKNNNQMFGETVNMQNNYSTGTVTAAKGSVGGFAGGAIIDKNQGTKSSDYTMSNNFSDSGSASKAIGSGSVSGVSAVANSEINSGISGLGFSNLTMTKVVNDHTATTSTTIKDLMGKGGSQTLTLTPTAGGEAVTLTFNETDTIQTVIDKLKAQGIDEADLTDGIFRIKDDKQWTISGALANKLFGGADDVYTFTGSKVTYTTTGAGTVGSVTGDKVTYETTVTGTVGSVTGDKLTYTVSTADGSIVSNEMLYKKLANNTMSISGNQLTYTTGAGTNSEGVTVTASGFSTAVTTQSTSATDKVYVSTLSDFVSGSTYYVKSASDLNKLAELTNAGKDTSGVTFVLENDIDLAGQQFVPIGTFNNPFKGNFYGNGHVIKNLTITDTSVLSEPFTSGSSKVYHAGLFGVTNGAKLYDIGLENVNINLSIDGVEDGVWAGALVGYEQYSEINNCYSTGSVSADAYAGGLVGVVVLDSSVSNSYSTVNVSGKSIVGGLVANLGGKISNSFATGNVNGSSAGGLVGYVSSSTISNSFATGNVSASEGSKQNGAGGLVGYAFSGNITISDSFAMGNVTGTASQGGVVGIDSATTTVTNCGYSGSTGLASGVTSGATAMTDAQLKSSIEGLGISSATVVSKTVETIATTSTKMSELGITDFTINGEALSGINADSTVVEVFTALKNEHDIEASISNGIVTFSATSNNYLEGEIINKFIGSKAVEFSTGLNGNSIKSNKVQYSTTETTSSDVYNPYDIIPESTNNTKIFDLYVQSMSAPSGKKISSGSITVGSITFTIDSSTTVRDLKRFLAGEDCYLDSIDGNGGSLYNIVSNNGASVSVSGDIANDVGGSLIGYLATKSTVSAGETVNHNIDNNTTIGQIFGDTASHTIKVGDETVTLQSTDKLSTLVSKLADKGVTAEIKNSALYLTTTNSTVFSGDIISRFFGQNKVIAGGSTYKYVDIELSTKFSDMGYDSTPVFEVDGTQIDGLTKDSTIQDLFNKLASKGINASLSNGKITLTSDTEHTLTGSAVEDFFDGAVTVGSSGGTTSKTYSGSVLKTVSKGYSTDTKLVDIDSSYKGTEMHVYKKNSSTSGTGTTSGSSGTSGNLEKPIKPLYEVVATLSIGENTTIQDVIDFYNPYLDTEKANVFKPLNKYSLEDGTITLAFKSGYSDKSFGSSDETTLSFGTTTPTVATTSTKLYELETSPAIISSIKLTNNGNKYSFDAGSDGTDSPTIQDVLDFLNNTAGCTATFTDGKLTVTGASDLEFEKPTTTSSSKKINVNQVYDMSVLFGGSMPTPTTSGGSGSTGGSSTQTATGTTKMSELGITDFKVNGSALSGITSDSTVDDVLAKLKSTYGLSEATISDGKITLKSNTSTTLSGNLIKGLMGQDSVTITPTAGTTTTTKTYTGTKVTYGATPATGYTTNTKLSTIMSHWVGQRIYVKSSEYTGSTTGYPSQGVLFSYLDIINTTTIDDVINFFNRSAGVRKATYDQSSGELELKLNVDYSVSAPFICSNDTSSLLGSTVIYSFDKTGGSRGSNMTASTTLADLNCLTAKDSKTLTVTNNGTTTSFDVSQETNLLVIISNLQSVGCTASITDGVLTVTGGEDLAFGGNTTVWKSIFGGSIPTPTTSTTTGGGSTGGGSTTTHTATEDTTFIDLGYSSGSCPEFKVDGRQITITSSNTIKNLLTLLERDYGITGSITDGKITLSSDTQHTLTGEAVNKLFGQSTVTITPTAGGSSTQTATENTTLGELGLTSFDLKINGTSISGLSADSKISDVFAKLADSNITATMTDGKITLTSNEATTLSGTVAEKLLGSSSVTLAGDSTEHTFDMEQISASKLLYTSRSLTYNSGAQKVSEVTELVAGNKYHIASEADLVKLAEFVNSGADTTGSIFIFDNDIDMSSVANFTSIGNDASHAFKGTIYGNGHVVKNLKIDSTSDYQGLFGYVQQATIQDLGVEDANIKGGAYSGILVGHAENAKLTNLYATGTVSGSSFVGGLVGSLKDSVLEKSYSTATVNASMAVTGGLVGYVVNSTLQTVYATGDVNCAASGVVGIFTGTGGLVGTMQSGGTIKNAFATGSVTTKSGGFNGGLIGFISDDSSSYTIDTVYATGNVKGSGGFNGGLIGTINNGSSATITNAIYNKNSVSNGVGNGSADGITGKNYEQMLMKSVMQNAGFTEDKGWVYKDGATPTFGNMTVSGGGGKVYLDDTITSFTSGSAYYISSLEQLNKLASLVNSGASTAGVSFILENDIDVSAFTTAIGSTEANAFKGTFYGNGHALTGLKTNLFNYIDGEAVIRDLGLENMTGSGHLASSVAGNSTIDNVYSTGSTTVSGLVNKLGGSATIKNSYSTAIVNSSSASAGGLVAQMSDSATIEKSFATGNVKASTSAGGLVGSMSGGTIKSSYATGNVTGGSNRGGLIGQVTGSVTIQNSYASGTATGGFIGKNAGTVTSTGNVYNSANSKAVGSGSSISGLTAISLADMKSQSKMEALGFTASNGWHYYAGKTPMLQGQDTSSGHSANVSLSTKIDSILNSGEGRNVKVTANGTTYEKWFEPTDTVKDVRDWLNTIDGVTATFDETNSTFKVSGSSEDFKIDGDLASALFGGRKTTTKTNATVNTDSNELLVDGSQTKITNNTTVGQLLGKASGNYAIGFYDDNGNLVTKNFGVDTKLSEVLQYLKDNGFEASIVNGVFTATKDGNTTTDILGTIGNKLKGETGTVTTTDTGYQTGVLGSSSSVKATASTKLSELGIDSGSILIKDNNNNNLGTIQINNSMTIDDTAQLLANYGFTLTITDGKVTVAGEGINRLADGTSNLVSKMKLDNWTETKDKLKTTSTVAQMGFGKGSTLSLILDNKTYNLKFDATGTLQDIIDTLGNYGVTASVDANGKFTASANGNLILSNELGAYLTQNSAEGYVKEANGYKSKDPLEFSGDKVKLDYDSTIGDILGTDKDGVLRLTIDNTTVVDLRYRADETMSDIIADLKGYGITATINDGVLTAVSDGHTFRFSGEIGKIISGDTPLYEDISTGYKSKDLSYETTGKATLDNTLKEMGISSGQIHVLSNDGKIVSTLDVDDSYTVAQVKSLLQPFGMDLAIDADGKVTVTSSEGYKLSDGTSNMVSTMKLNSWTTTTEKLTGATTLSQMGFKDGADLNLFLDGAVMNVLSFNADQTLDDIIFALSAYGIDASVNADGQFTATSKTHTFIMSGGLGSYLTKGTGGYVNSDTDYKSYKPLTEEHPYITDTSKEIGYKKLMTESSTLDSLGFAQGGSVRIMLDGTTPYSLEFLATDTVQDVIYALSAYGINAEVKDGKFVAESVNNTFTITGNFGSYLVQGGAYNNEVTGYESAPLTYNTTEKLTNDTKLASLGVTRGAINVIKDGKVADTINITNDTTIGQLFSAIKPYGMSGSIVTDASGNTSIRISADSDIKLADGTSNVVSALGLHDVRQGDFEGHKEYWDDDATSGLITEGMLLSSLDRNGFIAQGSLIFTTGEGDDAVQHIINITADETVGSLLKKFNDSGIKAELDNGIIKLTGGLDKLTFNGGTSGLVNTIGLDIHNIDKYASSSSALTYEGETHYSASNFANANTTLDIVNATDGIMSVFVDGIKCNVEVKSSDTFAELFKKIKDTVKAKSGFDIEAGFMTKDGTISTNPTDANNTGIIALSVAEGHELVIGASNDTTNFATIANLNKTGYNTITGSRALYRVNVNSLITQSGLYRDGDITEGTFIIGDAEFTIDSTTTLSSLINQINKNDKAYANAYWDTLSGTLVIQSTNTGASLINIEAGTSNFTDIMGFTKTKDGVSALVTDSQTLGQNAVVRINGTTVTSATNVITSDISRIKGLTINLKNVSEGETVTITVEQDKESIYNAVSDTLDSYNAMMEALNKELSDRSSLGGESILKLMRNNLKRLMTSSLTGAYVFKNLASVGISTGQASDDISTNVTSLLIDKDKFMDALNTDSDAVQDLLVGTKANPGIFLQANNIVESSIKTDGYFSNMANTLTKSINNIDKKITKANNDIENYRTKLQSKFHNMELTISGLQSAYANLLG